MKIFIITSMNSRFISSLCLQTNCEIFVKIVIFKFYSSTTNQKFSFTKKMRECHFNRLADGYAAHDGFFVIVRFFISRLCII